MFSIYLRKFFAVSFEFLISGNIITHFAVVEFFISYHIEIADTGKTKHNGLFLTGFFAFKGFVDSHTDSV